ncbi:hypothetical protein WDV82_10055 [Streptococcus agalactiae]|nr:hypothetical protein SDD34_10685 [Streptococcus agalactiae]
MNQIFSRVKFKKKYFVWLFTFLIIAIAGETALPTLMAEMIEQGVVNQATNSIWLLAGGMVLVVLILCGQYASRKDFLTDCDTLCS